MKESKAEFAILLGRKFSDRYVLAGLVGVLRDTPLGDVLRRQGITIHGKSGYLMLDLGKGNDWGEYETVRTKMLTLLKLFDDPYIRLLLGKHRLLRVIEEYPRDEAIIPFLVQKFFCIHAYDDEEECEKLPTVAKSKFGMADMFVNRKEFPDKIAGELYVHFPEQMDSDACISHVIEFFGKFISHAFCPRIPLTVDEQTQMDNFLAGIAQFITPIDPDH